MEKTVMITGATAGFGLACAELLAQKKYRLILCGRREDRLKALQSKLNTPTLALSFDVQIESEVQKAASQLPDNWKQIDVLLNNAGLALGKNLLFEGDSSDWNTMLDTNVKGILYVTKAFYPNLKKGKNAHVINIGSIAGKEVYPGGNVYCASKHAVDALTKAMRQEFLEDGIRVTQIAPGAAETEFSLVRFKGDEEKAKAVYKGFTPLSGADIAQCVDFVLHTPAHVCINDMVVMPSQQANSTLLKRS